MAKQYMFAFYWAASTLTTAGMVGYTTPKNARELVFVILCMLITLTIFAYVMGVLSPYATPCAARHAQKASASTHLALSAWSLSRCVLRRATVSVEPLNGIT
jgi:hypothetical protein